MVDNFLAVKRCSGHATRRPDGTISKAGETVCQLGWFEVVQIRGRIEAGKIDSYQVTLKAGFKLED